MSNYSLNAITAPDRYTQASTIEGISIVKIVLDVVNAAIYWQLKFGVASGVGGNWEDNETFLIPASKQIVRQGVVGIRVRAAIPLANLPVGGKQAVVTVNAVGT